MTPADHALLAALSDALGANPFAGTVRVLGVSLSRETARSLERQLLRLRAGQSRRAAR